MKNIATRFLREAGRHAVAAVFVLLATAAALGQGAPPGAPSPTAGGRPGVTSPRADTDARTHREARLRSAEIGATATGQMNRRQLAAAIEQTRNDFKRIQVVRNDIIDLLVSRRPLDYRQLAEQVGEVNKSAHRLKSFLMKPAGGEKSADEKKAEGAAPEYDEAGMRSALVKLCNTIHSFTGNPMFKNPEVVDARQPARAGGDLLAILDLSEAVKFNAERLAKASK